MNKFEILIRQTVGNRSVTVRCREKRKGSTCFNFVKAFYNILYRGCLNYNNILYDLSHTRSRSPSNTA